MLEELKSEPLEPAGRLYLEPAPISEDQNGALPMRPGAGKWAVFFRWASRLLDRWVTGWSELEYPPGELNEDGSSIQVGLHVRR